jgi:transcriptional regulator with XRE-family HTH domain
MSDEKHFVRGVGGALKLSQSYNFVDKREAIDELRTIIEDQSMAFKDVAEKSGVSRNTLDRWFLGKTMRPQLPTLNAVGRVFGKRLGWVDEGD